ncbi:hypothetical protein M569_09521 [Genlisea aurea]|uniref:BZIP domain-containing protein n=1 Tax=Genlisea aurea TaxID=192259 RepID=S8DYX7_9LAMI|nr:hypothetical protein M569_09521 [Genlisea aurea]
MENHGDGADGNAARQPAEPNHAFDLNVALPPPPEATTTTLLLRRKIRNQESAARSRARVQASSFICRNEIPTYRYICIHIYIQAYRNNLAGKEFEENVPEGLPEKRYQLRRTSSV